MNTEKLKQQIISARKFGVPLLAIETPDMAATMQFTLAAMTNGTVPPAYVWDIVGAMRWLNKEGEQALGRINVNAQALEEQTLNTTEMLAFCKKLDQRSVVFMMNAHLFYGQESVTQAIWNLRDAFKSTKRTLVMLGASMRMPAELERDVLVFDEPLPDDEALGKIADDLYNLIGTTTKFPKAMREQTIKAARGLSAFGAEQAIALSLTKTGIDTGSLWIHKKKMVEQVRGLSFVNDETRFSDIGGLTAIKQFGKRIFSGPKPPALICWIDEIEKVLGGSSGPIGDSSGTSQDQLGVLLKALEDSDSTGLIAVGPPGAGKSLFAKALGPTHDIPTLFVDLGSAKGSLVGESEARIRDMMKKINAISGHGGAFWVATANKLDVVPPELRRRFRYGTWMFAMPDAEERDQIWTLNIKKYGLSSKNYPKPLDEHLTGSDIRSICELSWRLSCSLEDAMAYISPIAISDPESIERIYQKAEGRFLSAAHGGLFKRVQHEQFVSPNRQIGV